MSTTEPLRPPHPHEVCGTCRWWEEYRYVSIPDHRNWGNCYAPAKSLWRVDDHTGERVLYEQPTAEYNRTDGCQLWEARGSA